MAPEHKFMKRSLFLKGESSMGTYTLPCVYQTASGNLLHESGKSTQVSVTPAGVGDGREVQEGGISVYLWLMPTYSRNQHNIVKQ